MPITDQLLDPLLADCKSPEDLMGEQGLLKLTERALEAVLEHHIGYAKHAFTGNKPAIPATVKPVKLCAL